jgi:hypothetical protein
MYMIHDSEFCIGHTVITKRARTSTASASAKQLEVTTPIHLVFDQAYEFEHLSITYLAFDPSIRYFCNFRVTKIDI